MQCNMTNHNQIKLTHCDEKMKIALNEHKETPSWAMVGPAKAGADP